MHFKFTTMIRKLYTRITCAILRQRYRWLYRRLFWHYAKRSDYADIAIDNANKAFECLTGTEWYEWLCYFNPKNLKEDS